MLVVERAHAQSSPIQTKNPTFQASIDRIAKRSALWREATDALRVSGRRVVLVTPDQVLVADSDQDGQPDRFDETLLAEVAPVVDAHARVDVVVVVINLPLLEYRHQERNLLPIELAMDLDRIVVHEVYGHAIPYLLAGHISGRCADPEPRQRAVDACSIRRENAVRAELGLGRRIDYGLQSLNVTRDRHDRHDD
jgi:hypothetical protein